MRSALLIVMTLPLVARSADMTSETTPGIVVDFRSRVRPIFETHCIDCHSGKSPLGGLDLTSVYAARRGGDSGRPILTDAESADLSENELLFRVTTDDITLRMPKGGDALSEEEQNTLREWLAGGSPWPASEVLGDEEETSEDGGGGRQKVTGWYDTPPFSWLNAFALYVEHVPGFRWWVGGFALGTLVLLLLERRKRKPMPAGQTPGRLRRLAERIDSWHHVGLLTAFVLGFLLVRELAVHERTRKRVGSLEKTVQEFREPPSVFGDPPIPVRIRHARGLAKTFYRGNCETTDKLYNQGNYCTAMFHLATADAEGRPLAAGDVVPKSGVFLDITLERAPGATERLFEPAIIERVLWSPGYWTSDSKPTEQEIEELASAPGLTPAGENRWTVRLRIPVEPAESTPHVIYLYQGRPEKNGSFTQQPAYAVVTELIARDGRLAEESDVWMGPLFFPGNVQRPEREKLPTSQWFDSRPLPFIEGAHTSDPELLGLEEHLGRQPLRAPRP